MILDAAGKLLFHADRVHELMTKGSTNPVHVTVGLSNYCNHKCVWCYIDFVHEQAKKAVNADIDKMLAALKDARDIGVKAITLVGDGEPTLHPRFIEFVDRARALGLDIGIFTNGGWRQDEITDALFRTMTFVRFSLDAATPSLHEQLHRAKDFPLIESHIRQLVERKRAQKRALPTIGVQFSVSHRNVHEALAAVDWCKNIGADYIAFKPVYKNVLNEEHEDNQVDAATLDRILHEAKTRETAGFSVLWKQWQMDSLVFDRTKKQPYAQCLAIWLSPYIDEDGYVEFCGNLKGRGFTIGNVYQEPFRDIWGGKKHREQVARIALAECPRGCKLHGLNVRLWQIAHPAPQEHSNFI